MICNSRSIKYDAKSKSYIDHKIQRFKFLLFTYTCFHHIVTSRSQDCPVSGKETEEIPRPVDAGLK